MNQSRLAWIPGLLAVMILAGAGAGTSAEDSPADKALAKVGLKHAGALAVPEAESDVHAKTTEARQIYRDWSNAVMQQRSTVSEKEYQATIKALTNETNELRKELNNTNQMLNSIPTFRGRAVSSYAYQQEYDLNAYKQQLQWEINQRTTFLNQLKSQSFDPKAKIKLDTEVRTKKEALHKAVMDLRKLVDETDEKYKELSKNDEVKKVLTSLEKKSDTKLKLGQSRQYHLDVRYLEKMEQESGSVESATSNAPGKAAKKGRRTKARRPYRPSGDDEDMPSPF